MELLEFYPTPKSLLDKIFVNVKLDKVKTVLEPSAGKGDIVEYINEKTKYRYSWSCAVDIDCVEKDENLRSILKGKNLRVVHDDFLTYHTFKHYDLIVMNPPFSDGDKHLTKALEMQKKTGGDVICILNAETIKNPYSNVRKALIKELEDINADIEYMQSEFSSAERKTNVEIAVIKAHYPEPKLHASIFDRLKAKRYADVTIADEITELAPNDFVEAIVKNYEIELQAGIMLIKEYQAMLPHLAYDIKKDKDDYRTSGILTLKVGNSDLSINRYVEEVRMKYWKALFADSRITGKMTSNLREVYQSKVNELKDYDFSTYNIRTLQMEMSKHLVSGIEDCIVKTFDELSYQYSYRNSEYEKNVHYYNGWSTNKSWVINTKVIIPMYGVVNRWDNKLQVDNYDVIAKLSDIEKSLDYLDCGRTTCNEALRDTLTTAQRNGESKNIKLKYFDVTFYKKGTCHITFTNEELLKKLNIFGSQQKGWLPESYGKKQYEDMNEAEKRVVNEFEGRDSYNKVMQNRSLYIMDSSNLIGIERKDIA